MADAAMPVNAAASGESPAQLKARLRRERLASKSSGASRLQKITALQGGPPRALSEVEKDVPVKPSTPSQFNPAAASGTATPDPEEEDISQHHYTPASQPRLPSPFALDGNTGGPFGDAPGSDPSHDPMMAMLQQMMGAGAGGMPSAQPGAAPGNLPPGLANMLSAMQGGAAPAEPLPEKSSAWMWHLVHSIFSLGLAIYIVLQTPFTGSKLSRDSVVEEDWTVESKSAHSFANFFYLFATFEVVMQSSRYFIEKGQLQGSGILNTVAGILPAPYSGYIKTIGRYSVIYSTIMSDAMVVVFVLGASSWWRGAVVA
ncbi:hypothetical protein LEMA_P044520.1 [Plenodomus lingam JN3]|uniref:Uncharacterized protein n=1 Tax=Leptosphaeria maculans (strain JN3 / isolate v23.1.3 / race Av1-4-5-6-7-8) TaxID=985895 RepID=E4ZQ16_LEPMJ|nr:hypothetical protein LEMA_P044520.1 [Plenodomus lingam JN3]CBX93551.1 hypothetical protein LEMA_P044520.1 [Plenodomus lingam JN3]